jgi:hypothetical protein
MPIFPVTRRIAFLFFYHAYHAYHSAPIAFELSRLDPDLDVHLFASYQDSYDLLEQIGSLYDEHRCTIHLLRSRWYDWYHRFSRRSIPSPRRMMNRHAGRFRDMDAFVDTTYAALRLKRKYGFTQARYILAFHGAGDRKRRPPEFLRAYDFLLLYGPKYYQRLNKLGVLTENNWAYLGYPKFDVTLHEQAPSLALFPEQKPIVLYNPHFEPAVSSWFEWGRHILDFFASSKRYNLIFAPHVELKGRTDPRLSVEKYAAMPNIHVDLGSPSCLDMTYLKAADIYLGDVSSQVTEYLVQPRPCVFLNNHQISWENNTHYMLWKAGQVVEDLSLLEQSLEDAVNSHARYRPAQLEYFNDSINLTDTPSGLRGARAIYELLKSPKRS